ncbi:MULTISPECIES: Dabb family protein [Mycobacterium]|uniref:Stress responsive protein n=1 Tax=Mycobacterium kiyosense TaxID=2871094 RepID=A0A9P3Q5H7_9MYCO|nr:MULTISPECIES: Dabb family protein [Mycobacterium]BDB41836.1 stress responsive protein [Mycobacterium kiyosense]BDE14871.1 stress responsive protein [Mycobacterium sp. 20KCMC460]GLB82245.1 stress responsive protein [Mycobacterium kiyosense]GLB89295.1 stress responsive protein [Mycobacterium kiyosense]GLB95949.1 stress responsive protein [Mycobacterium kiyosense]
MYSVTRLLDVNAGDRDRILAEVRARTAHAPRRIVAPTMPGSRNGGDVLVHLRFPSESQWRSLQEDFDAALTDSAITRVNGVDYTGDLTHTGSTRGSVYRTLLLRVMPATGAATLARFEDELRSIPRHVHTITAWQLSRAAATVGATPWTHVFEQEFTDVDGLAGPYLMHPIHWAVVDRWFDPECPDVIVRDRVCHSFCALPAR